MTTKYYILLFFSMSVSLLAQQNSETDMPNDSTETYQDYTALKFSLMAPNPLGNNFATEGLDFKYGYNLDLNYFFPFHLMIGYKYQYMRAEPGNTNLVGNYDRVNINTHGLNLGYRYNFLKVFDIEPVFTIAYTSYNNKKNFSSNYNGRIKFIDEATSLILSTSINYNFSKGTSVFLQPDYRIDFMNIETAQERQDFFKRATYFNIQVGVRFNFD